MEKILHGIDLVDFPRIEEMINRHGSHFLDRIFTQTEQQQASVIKNRVERLAGRFAAKEAILKLLGTGWRDKIASKIRVRDISLSITHTANFAIASAVGLAEEK